MKDLTKSISHNFTFGYVVYYKKINNRYNILEIDLDKLKNSRCLQNEKFLYEYKRRLLNLKKKPAIVNL